MRKKLNIFISYRRADSRDFAGRLYDNLAYEYNVFFDTEDGIGAGEKFLNVIVEEIDKADLFLMVVGKESAKEFKIRENQDDYVLKEIIHAKKSSCKIIPVLMNEVTSIEYLPKELEFVSALSYYEFAHAKFSLNLEGLKQEIEKCTLKESKVKNMTFMQEVREGIERDRLLVLFSQDFTNIDTYYQHVKNQMYSKFSKQFYMVSVPSFVDDQEEYFTYIAKGCEIHCEIKKENDWFSAIKEKLKSNNDALLLFVTDLENGNEELDRKFATMLRNLKEKFPHFHALFVGKKELAKLVYGEGDLSPLNTAKELFFPDDGMKLGEERIAQQFQTLGKNRDEVCKLLQKERVAPFSVWSYNEIINKLFWKNLLVKEGRKLVWRGEVTKEIARDVLECEM